MGEVSSRIEGTTRAAVYSYVGLSGGSFGSSPRKFTSAGADGVSVLALTHHLISLQGLLGTQPLFSPLSRGMSLSGISQTCPRNGEISLVILRRHYLADPPVTHG